MKNKVSLRSQIMIVCLPVFGLALFAPSVSHELARSLMDVMIKDMVTGRSGAILVMLILPLVALIMQYFPFYAFYRIQKTKIGIISVIFPTLFYILNFVPLHVNNYEFFFFSVVLNSMVFTFFVYRHTKSWNKNTLDGERK